MTISAGGTRPNSSTIRLDLLSNRIQTCELCEELVKTRKQPVTGYGDYTADIFIIGEAPGRLGANITGVPFTKDKSGVFLQQMLCKIGLNESNPKSTRPRLKNVYMTNIVKCNPQAENGTNRPPKNEEVRNCQDHLQDELDIIKPMLVVPLGIPAAKSILGDDFDGKNFGRFVRKQKFTVLPLWHPAFVIRGGGRQKMNEARYSEFFDKIIQFVAGTAK